MPPPTVSLVVTKTVGSWHQLTALTSSSESIPPLPSHPTAPPAMSLRANVSFPFSPNPPPTNYLWLLLITSSCRAARRESRKHGPTGGNWESRSWLWLQCTRGRSSLSECCVASTAPKLLIPPCFTLASFPRIQNIAPKNSVPARHLPPSLSTLTFIRNQMQFYCSDVFVSWWSVSLFNL